MAEQVIGSDKAFRMAVEETLGRALKKGELEDMMQKKQLDPSKILPLVGKYFLKLAQNGGALKDKMQQLNAVQNRMNQSWLFWINSIYEGGLAEGLKGLYKTLDDIFWFMKQGDSLAGGFLKGFLDSLNSSIVFVYNNALKLYYMLKYDLGMSLKGEWFGTAAYWLTLAATFNVIYKTLSLMLTGGLLSKLTSLGAASTGVAVGVGAGAVGFIPAVRIAAIEGTVLFSLARAILEGTSVDKSMGKLGGYVYDRTHITDQNSKDYGSFSFQKWLTGNTIPLSAYQTPSALSQMTSGGLATRGYSYNTQPPVPAEPQKIIVEVKDSEFSKAIQISFQENMGKVVNSMMPASPQAPSLLIK